MICPTCGDHGHIAPHHPEGAYMQKRICRKPQLTELDLSRTPRAWRLLQAVLEIRDEQPVLLTAVLSLAHHAATLAQGMQVVEGAVSPEMAQLPPPDPDRIDHSTEMLTGRDGRLAGINVTCKRALIHVLRKDYAGALAAVCEALDGLGLDRPRCCVVASAS